MVDVPAAAFAHGAEGQEGNVSKPSTIGGKTCALTVPTNKHK